MLKEFAEFHAQRRSVDRPVTNQLPFGRDARSASEDDFLRLGMRGKHVFEYKRQCPIVYAPPPSLFSSMSGVKKWYLCIFIIKGWSGLHETISACQDVHDKIVPKAKLFHQSSAM